MCLKHYKLQWQWLIGPRIGSLIYIFEIYIKDPIGPRIQYWKKETLLILKKRALQSWKYYRALYQTFKKNELVNMIKLKSEFYATLRMSFASSNWGMFSKSWSNESNNSSNYVKIHVSCTGEPKWKQTKFRETARLKKNIHKKKEL